jgi:phospholipase/carboxylesterase
MADLSFIHYYHASQNSQAPTILLLHGTGGNEHDLVRLGRALAPDANILSPRGQVLENGMPRFFRRLAEGVFDMEDLKQRTADLAAFVAEASQAYGFDASKVFAVGYSNGANIAANVLLTQTGVLAGAVLFHAMVPSVPEPLPNLSGVPIFLSGGLRDPMITAAQTQQLADMFEQAGAAVHMHWEPGGHQLSQTEFTEAQRWLQPYLS